MTLASNGLANAIPFRFTYADATIRAAATGFTSADLYSLALQLDNASVWILTATTPTWVAAAGSGMTNPMTTKGDLITGGAGGTPGRRAVGSDGQVLTADSAQADGVKWATPSSSAALVKIEEQILGSAAANIRLPASGSLPTGYRDLVFRITGRTNKAGQNYDGVRCRINGDTGNNYDSTSIFQVGGNAASGVGSNSGVSAWVVGFLAGDGNTAGRAGAAEVTISDYARTQWNKVFTSIATRGEPAVGVIEIDGGSWRSTAAITDLLLFPVDGTQFLAGTVATLYGRG